MSNSLYDQLKAGTSAEDIAAAFAKELNDAEERIRLEEEEAKRQAQAQAEAETLAQRKRADIMSLLDSAICILSTYYPSFGIKYDDFSDEGLEPLVDLTIALLDLEAMKPAKRSFKIKNYTKPTSDIIEDDTCTATVPRAVRGQRAETNPIDEVCDPFADFFKAFGL